MNAVFCHLKDCSSDEVVPIARSLCIDQEGSFLLNGKWIPCRATQEFRTSYKNPGFVWGAKFESRVPLTTIPIYVCDAYIDGVGIMKAQLPGGVPIVRPKFSDELNQGELLRWVSEAVLFPLALLPPVDTNDDCEESKKTSLRWRPSGDGDENSAILELKYRGMTAGVTFHFDPRTKMISSVKTRRPRAVGNKYEMSAWEGFFSHYEIHSGFNVPTVMEAGWRLESDGPLEMYFKSVNRNFVYDATLM